MVNYGQEWQGALQMHQDPYYNPDKAKAKFAEAKKIEAKGVQFQSQDISWPIS